MLIAAAKRIAARACGIIPLTPLTMAVFTSVTWAVTNPRLADLQQTRLNVRRSAETQTLTCKKGLVCA